MRTKGTQRRRSVAWIAALLMMGSAGAADTAQAQDGLVLSGGGSRGLAHAGAITGLERLGLKPDIVVGASMGAIIGGLYASGMSTDTIRAIVRSQDWQDLFAPLAVRPGPNGVPVRPITRLGVLAGGDSYADGLIPAWRVNRELVRLFLDPAFRSRGDFDALPRRFRAVSSDLRTGEAVVLGSGDLARAIRASMAVPGVFAPVLLDGAVLVDGGLADYLPVGPARRAGARRVIAVDVIRPPPNGVGLNPFDAALRAFRLTLYSARQDRDTADISIHPAIDPEMFAAVFLRDPQPLMDAGLEAALALPITFDSPAAERQPRPAPTSFAGLRVESNDPALEGLVRESFASIAANQYDRDALLAAADGLYSTGLFTGVWPRIETDGSADTLVVLAEAFAPTTMMGGAGYDTDRGFRGWAALSRRLGSRLEATIAAKADGIESWGVASARIRPSDRWPSVALETGVSAEATDVRVFDGEETIGESRVTRLGGWSGASWRVPEPNVEASVLMAAEWIDDGPADGLAWGPTLRISSPTPNATIVGTPIRFEAEWRFGDFDYRLFRAAGSAGTVLGRLRAAVVGDVTFTQGDAPFDAWPSHGDDHAMPGLRYGAMRAPAMAVAGVDLAVASPFESHTRLRLRAATIADEPADLASNRWRGGAAVGVLWWTPLGKVAVEAGLMEGGSWLLRLDVGPTF
jgi:predicted acylesterase/phospholipase RssA